MNLDVYIIYILTKKNIIHIYILIGLDSTFKSLELIQEDLSVHSKV